MKKVAMKVNQANLVKSLKYSFTNRTTVLGELMQNARRAGATQVNFEYAPETKILKVTDDGCGIESIETLLTVAESGWDADVVAQEHPFGVGFLSALFACRHLTVASKSGRFSVDTDDVLSFKPVTVSPVAEWDGITSIIMVGFDTMPEKLGQAIAHLAKGFTIPVALNGDMVARPHALDSGLDFAETGIGLIHLHGLQAPNYPTSDYQVYLQGLPIYKSQGYCRNEHVIHLDPSKFNARLPDRDKLLDESEALLLVKAALQAGVEKRLLHLKNTLSAEDFVGYFETIRHWNLLGLLNDVDAVPTGALNVISSYPVCNNDAYGSFEEHPKTPVGRLAIESGQTDVVDIDDDIQNDGAARYMFAWLRGSLVYRGNLDKGHWINSYVRPLSNEKVTVECINESHYAHFEGSWASVGVTFCDAYRIKIGADVVEIDNHAFYKGEDNGNVVIMPKGGLSADVIEQVASFMSEYDGYQESTHDDDCGKFFSFLVANTASDPAGAIRQLLPEFTGCPVVFGKAFIVSLDDQGKVASVTAA